jgi:hypothetical protein
MTSIFEIPMVPSEPRSMSIPLGGNNYRLVLLYRDADMGGWMLDIFDDQGNALACGIPLVTGHDLLEQYVYLNINGQLWVTTDGDPDTPPAFDTIGLTSHLYWVTEP